MSENKTVPRKRRFAGIHKVSPYSGMRLTLKCRLIPKFSVSPYLCVDKNESKSWSPPDSRDIPHVIRIDENGFIGVDRMVGINTRPLSTTCDDDILQYVIVTIHIDYRHPRAEVTSFSQLSTVNCQLSVPSASYSSHRLVRLVSFCWFILVQFLLGDFTKDWKPIIAIQFYMNDVTVVQQKMPLSLLFLGICDEKTITEVSLPFEAVFQMIIL